jgi:hypothetical protein
MKLHYMINYVFFYHCWFLSFNIFQHFFQDMFLKYVIKIELINVNHT